MASNNNGIGGKEERRRRIAERGSDRMALITGRINALPPTPTSAASSPIYPRHGQTMSASVFDEYLGLYFLVYLLLIVIKFLNSSINGCGHVTVCFIL